MIKETFATMRENFQRRSFVMSEVKAEGIKCVDYKVETHPFDPFINEKTQVLIVGTFPPSRFAVSDKKIDSEGYLITQNSKGEKIKEVHWFYGSKDNGLWILMEEIFGGFGSNIQSRQERCKSLGIGFVDLFHTIGRYDQDWSSDETIYAIEVRSLSYILERNPQITHILFTSNLSKEFSRKEYLRDNQEWLKKNSLEKKGVYKLKNGKQIYFNSLPSPSSRNVDENKKGKWRDIFKEIGLLKSN